MNKKAIRWLICLVLVFVMMFSLAACGEGTKDDDGKDDDGTINVSDNIDFSSVTQDGDYTNFNVILKSGETIRFQGKNVTVSENGITMAPGALLVSLDYIGEISLVECDADIEENSFDFGIAYADAPSVDNMTDLQVAFAWGIGVSKDMTVYMPMGQSGFLAVKMSDNNQKNVSLTNLLIHCNPDAKQVFYSELDPASEAFRIIALYPAAWTDNKGEQTDAFEFGKEGVVWDVIANIEPASVEQDGVFTNFTVKTSDGITVHFQGIGITVAKNQLILEPGAKLFMLDHIGKVLGTKITSKRGGNTVEVGAGYANKASVDSMTKLKAGFPGAGVEFDKTVVRDMENYDTSFFGMTVPSSQTAPMELEELLVNYDPNRKQVFYSALSEQDNGLQLITNAGIDWTDSKNLHYGVDKDTLAKMKLKEEGTLRCDIIAGIDRSSIKVKDTITLFNSVMSDGTVVRFEGENIDITDDGIMIRPDSKVTSLDAVGKIFAYTAHVKDGEKYTDGNAGFNFSYAYTYSAKKTSVDKASQIHTYPFARMTAMYDNGWLLSAMVYEPNFICFEGNSYFNDNLVLTSIEVIYNPAEKVTAIVDVDLNLDFSTAYLEGELYNQNMEGLADSSAGIYNFYLLLKPDTACSYIDSPDCIWFVPNDFYKVGDLRDANGNALDKTAAKLAEGTTLDITVGDFDLKLELPMVERYDGAQTMNDLVPYAFPKALGTNYTLVIPVAWADQKANATDEALALYRKNIGRVMDAKGNITDYSDSTDEEFSLSEYFDVASYGKFTVNSFMTDWYYSDKNFTDAEFMAPDKVYGDEILEWVKKTYPDLDWSKFDRDGNGYVDSIVIINSGVSQRDGYNIISFGGAIHYRHSYYGDYAGTPDNPNANTYVTINDSFLKKEGADTLIHEFTHNFGIIDYYDVTYSGINAVGGYDMQSDNKGDWNAYSKLSVGWMEPKVVEGLKSGESKEFTIGSLALANDVIVIPATGTKYAGPFSEYIMIDLLSDDGVNKYDAANYGLDNVTGIRISHVNANMEKRTMEIESKTNPGDIAVYDIGTIHIANDYKDDGLGRYNIEVIQSGKKNTFTNQDSGDTMLSAEDLFYKGDKFTVEGYKEFFHNGRMDDGSEFGYTVEIVSIGKDASGNPTATVRVTAQ